MCNERRILLIIGGGIAAYKCLELIRRGRERGLAFRCVLTAAASQFVTPLSVASLAGEKVYDQLFSLTDEAEMGHIRLSREADLVVVAPATADLMAKMAAGLADDLASTLLLASDKPVLIAPAMNPQMWAHPATRRNLARLSEDGVHLVGLNPGDMACGEVGSGRMAEPHEILAGIEALLAPPARPLAGMRAIVTSGPTREPLDPVRFLSNHSSGRQGHAIARALAEAGAVVVLVSGPVAEPDPPGVALVHVETAREMLAAVEDALPAEIAVCAAAVADWRPVEASAGKIKKREGAAPPAIELVENPDILRALATHARRPRLVVGFAAETGDLEQRARAKLARKGCDWILANDVSTGTGVFGGERNRILFLPGPGPAEAWPELDKTAVARRLVERIAATLAGNVVHAWAVTVPIERLPHGADLPLPGYASDGAAGLDLLAAVDTTMRLEPMGRALVPTGIRLALPEGFEAQIRPRSGLALRHGVTVLNAPGTIDADYRGEIAVILINLGSVSFAIERGARIAQLVVAPVLRGAWAERPVHADGTRRGDGGFGSTG